MLILKTYTIFSISKESIEKVINLTFFYIFRAEVVRSSQVFLEI